jgi:WD40 repeat protein
VPPLLRFGDARLRHSAPVTSLALTPDGARLLTATRAEPVLRLWDVKTGQLLRAVRVMDELTVAMTVLALTPDGRRAFVVRHQARQRDSDDPGNEPATVDLATGAVVRWDLGRKLGEKHPLFALSPDGKTLAGIIGGEVRTWESDSGVQRVLGTIPKWIAYTGSICFSPDGSQIAACCSRGALFIAAANGNGPLQSIPIACNHEEVCAVFWPQPNRVVALWRVGLAAFDPRTGAEIERSDKFDGGPDEIPTQAGGGKLFVKEEPTTPIATFDLATLARAPKGVARHSERAGAFAVAANGRVLAVAQGHAVRAFDPRTGSPLHPDLESAPFEPLARLQLSPDGARVLGCTAADTAHARELSNDRPPAGFDGSSWLLTRSALSPDGRLASGGLSSAGRPLVTELPGGRTFPLPAHEKTAHAPEVIGFTGPNHVWLWNRLANTCAPFDIGTNRLGPAVRGFTYAKFVAVSPDGRKLAAIGLEGLGIRELGSDREWDTLDTLGERAWRPRKVRAEPPPSAQVRFSPCGRWLLVCEYGLELWDLRTTPLRIAPFESANRTGSEGGFSPDGRFFAGAVWGPDGGTELCVWETASGDEVYRFRPARGAAGCAFTPDGRGLVIAHTDTTFGVWNRAAVEARHCPEVAVPVGEEWDWLGSTDAKRGRAGVRALVANPNRALTLLAAGLEVPGALRLNQLLTELGADEFRVRESAERALAELGPRAESALQRAVTSAESPEVRARAAVLLKALKPTGRRVTGDRLRTTRAVEVLERIASPEAEALLATWAATDPDGLLAREANSARARLVKK